MSKHNHATAPATLAWLEEFKQCLIKICGQDVAPALNRMTEQELLALCREMRHVLDA